MADPKHAVQPEYKPGIFHLLERFSDGSTNDVGPIVGVAEAVDTAKRRLAGCRSMRSVEILLLNADMPRDHLVGVVEWWRPLPPPREIKLRVVDHAYLQRE